jgi:DNA-binding CsgD family transcriptional regulator
VRTYAAEAGVTEGTARIRLKQVLAKTGAARQADLVRIVLSSLPGLL